ncbi:guanylate cyclase, partial [Monoraphidium neglectum]
MLGIINLAFEAFVKRDYGENVWMEIVQRCPGVATNWVSSCPYSDKAIYQLGAAAAAVLKMSFDDVIEAFGVDFVRYAEEKGYGRLMQVLGSNVTADSLLLHYHSSRPGMWPLVAGILKGMAEEYFGFTLGVELVASRHQGHDHEIFRLTYPHQEAIRARDDTARKAAASLFAMPPNMFYELHPFHLLMAEERLTLLQVGPALGRLLPEAQAGDPFGYHFKIRHPYVPVDYNAITGFFNTTFLVNARNTMLELIGQMLPVTLPADEGTPGSEGGAGGRGGPRRALLFLGSPRCGSLSEMQAQQLFLSDIPLHDMSRDFILLAEQRQ